MSKEALVIIFDQSLSMNTNPPEQLELGKKCLKMMMINSPKDEVAFLKIGTKETENHLNDKHDEEYENIIEEQPLIPVRFDLFSIIEGITINGENSHPFSDVLDGIIIAFDLIFKKCGKKKSYRKRIVLLTDGKCDLDGDDMKDVAKNIKMNSVQFLVLGVGFGMNTCTTNCQVLLKEMVESMDNSFIMSVTQADEKLSVVSKKVRVQRGTNFDLSICDNEITLPIQRFKKTEKTAFPKLTKYSKKSQQMTDQSNATGKVKTDRTYYLMDNPDEQIQAEDTIKAFKYGKNLVPVSKVDEEALKFRSVKSYELLGFIPYGKVRRQHLLGESYVCVAKTKGASDEEKQTFSLLVQALFEMDFVAIVRMVYRKNSQPKICVLFPKRKLDNDFFYANELPFFEDYREFQFKSLNEINVSDNQLTAVEDLMKSMDLMKIKDENEELTEAFKPKNIFNPVNQYFYDCLNHRALNEDSNELPEVNPVLLKRFLPDLSNDSFYSKMIEEGSDYVNQFKELFPLKKVEKTGKKRPYFWFSTENPTLDTLTNQPITGDGTAQPNKRQKTGENEEVHLFTEELTKITTSNPVKDFKTIVEKDERRIETAMRQMEVVIFSLVDNSMKNINYEKAKSCVEIARSTCLGTGKADKIKLFNEVMKKIKARYAKTKEIHYLFWDFLKKKKLSIISKTENVASEITEEEGKVFFNDIVEEIVIVEEDEPEDDGIFDDLE